MMWGGAFPEPLTFSIRALRALRARARDFDIVHDNQGLGYGMLGVPRLGLPLVTSIHHPITVDKRLDLAELSWLQALSRRRWYGFVRMQGRVARRAGPLITVSQSSKNDICRDFRVSPENVRIVPLGVDTRRFHPREAPRVRGRIVTVTSADSPLKGLSALLRAVAKLLTERDVHLIVVGLPSDTTKKLAAQLSLADKVTFASGLPDDDYAALLASAEIAVVPSLYEGFSLPAVEHMASGTPLIASRAGALPEVVGEAALLVQPGDPEELGAALRTLHDDLGERTRLAGGGLKRVGERFAWPAVAAATAALYREVINGRASRMSQAGTAC
jgi:glycosyltransferase involved in cell wall biosynthesis